MVNNYLLDELRNKKAQEIEKITTIREMRSYINKIGVDCFLVFRTYIKNEYTIRMYNLALDEILKEKFDLIIDTCNKEFDVNEAYCDYYYLFHQNKNNQLNYYFLLLELRMKENSGLLNDVKYFNLLNIYKNYLLIEEYERENTHRRSPKVESLLVNKQELINDVLDKNTLIKIK